jgi:hypothetical protein
VIEHDCKDLDRTNQGIRDAIDSAESAGTEAEHPDGVSFANLYGILAGQLDSSAEEIDAMHYRFQWRVIEKGSA